MSHPTWQAKETHTRKEIPERWDLDAYGPRLSDEDDIQLWVAHRVASLPMGVCGDTPMTIIRANGRPATSWSLKDYADMSVFVGDFVCCKIGRAHV